MNSRPVGPSEDSTEPNPDQNHTQQMTSVNNNNNNNTKLNKSTSELREQGNRRKRRRMRRGVGGGGWSGVTFVAMLRLHKFISPSNWLMKHTCGEEQREQPKGKKNVSGEKKKPVSAPAPPACRPLHRGELLPRRGTSRETRTGPRLELGRLLRGRTWRAFTHSAGCRRATPSPAPTL